MTPKDARRKALESEADVPLLTRLRWAKQMLAIGATPIQRALAATRLYGEQAEKEAQQESKDSSIGTEKPIQET